MSSTSRMRIWHRGPKGILKLVDLYQIWLNHVRGYKVREGLLSSDLQNEIYVQEVEVAQLFSDLQIFKICFQVFKNKVHKPIATSNNLEDKSTFKRSKN